VASLHLKNACVLAVFCLLAAPFGASVLKSVALGGMLAAVNLRLLERSVIAPLTAPDGGGIVLRLFLHMRMGLLFAVLAVVLLSERAEPLPLTLGLSSAVPAVLWHGWRNREGQQA
jgi:hypothetical protein